MAALMPKVSNARRRGYRERPVEIREVDDAAGRDRGAGGAGRLDRVRIDPVSLLPCSGRDTRQDGRARRRRPGRSPPSCRRTAARSCVRIVSKTGDVSAIELLIAARTSPDARCWSSASFVSLNSRTFSIAIAAWSPNVLSSAISRSLNGRTSLRRSRIGAEGLAFAISAASPAACDCRTGAKSPRRTDIRMPRTARRGREWSCARARPGRKSIRG